jgi:hypothetical protein
MPIINADLHLHSRASDGSNTLSELIEDARARGMACIAVTDHDYTGHLDDAVAFGAKHGMRIVPGIEISGRGAHILGYYLRSYSPAVAGVCSPLLRRRHSATLEALEAFRARGVPVELGDVERVAYGHRCPECADGPADRSPVLYRQHLLCAVREALRRVGRPETDFAPLREAVYADGACAIPPSSYPDPVDAVRAIVEDGGVAVLAHPGLSGSWDLLPALVEAGLSGIEENHPNHGSADRARVRGLRSRYRLFGTGGTDSHGFYDEIETNAAAVAAREVDRTAAETLCPAECAVYFTSPDGPDLLLAERIADDAGAYLRGVLGSGQDLAVDRKNGDHRDLVSACDRAVEQNIRSALAHARPADLVLGEEGEQVTTPADARVWIVDPIDGTTNFLRRGGDFAVSLALWRAKVPVLGIVYDVSADRMYRCVPGSGVTIDGFFPPARSASADEDSAAAEPLDPLNGLILDAGLNTIAALKRRGVDIERLSARLLGHRSLGCASLAITRVALGELDAFASDRLRPWDWAAAAILLAENGGRCLGLAGSVPDPYDPAPIPFLAARSPAVAAALAPVLSGGECT